MSRVQELREPCFAKPTTSGNLLLRRVRKGKTPFRYMRKWPDPEIGSVRRGTTLLESSEGPPRKRQRTRGTEEDPESDSDTVSFDADEQEGILAIQNQIDQCFAREASDSRVVPEVPDEPVCESSSESEPEQQAEAKRRKVTNTFDDPEADFPFSESESE